MIKIVSAAFASVAALAARVTVPTTGGALKSLTKTLEKLEAVTLHHEAKSEKLDAAIIKSEDKTDAIVKAAYDKHDAFEEAAKLKSEAALAEAAQANKVRTRIATLLA